MEIANFKAELEALRLRMIDACLHGHVCEIEPPPALVIARALNEGTASQQVGYGQPMQTVQDEVASAVRLLVTSENGCRK